MADHSKPSIHIQPSNLDTPATIATDTSELPCLIAALDYLRRGWCAIPLCCPHHTGRLPSNHGHHPDRQGKVPLVPWKELQKRRPTEEELVEWWKAWPTANVGIILGRVSGLVAIDVDGPEGMDQLAELLGGEPAETLEFQTGGGGRRWLYRWPEDRLWQTRHFCTSKKPLSFLAEGAQTVMPPSVHLSGRKYLWPEQGNPALTAIADAPQELVNVLACARDKRKRTTRGGMRGGVSAGSGRPDWRERGRAYCDTCPPAVSEQGGHIQLFKVATGLVRTVGLNAEQTFIVLMNDYNQRCEPEWLEGDIRHKANDAWAKWGAGSAGLGAGSDSPQLPIEQGPARYGRSVDSGMTPPCQSATSLVSNASLIPTCQSNGRALGGVPVAPAAAPAHVTDNAAELPKRPGRLASEYEVGHPTWFLQPYVPSKTLTLIVGYPGAGKSTFSAYLISKAKRAVLLPGYEEDFRVMTLPRLIAHGVDRDNVLILDRDRWELPVDRDRLLEVVRDHGADLVLMDPIGSYLLEGGSENEGAFVRAALEAAAWIASETGAAVVGVRHPGKNATNVMVGSAQWRAVPRSIVELVADPGPPLVRMIQLYKDGLGQNAPSRRFELIGQQGKPPVFSIGEECSHEEAELAKEVPDRMERSKVDQAEDLLLALLANGRMVVSDIIERGKGEGLTYNHLYRAAKRMGVDMRDREGQGKEHRHYWKLPPTACP